MEIFQRDNNKRTENLKILADFESNIGSAVFTYRNQSRDQMIDNRRGASKILGDIQTHPFDKYPSYSHQMNVQLFYDFKTRHFMIGPGGGWDLSGFAMASLTTDMWIVEFMKGTKIHKYKIQRYTNTKIQNSKIHKHKIHKYKIQNSKIQKYRGFKWFWNGGWPLTRWIDEREPQLNS